MTFKRILSIFIVLATQGQIIGQCPTFNPLLKSQADVDSFPIKYTNCRDLKTSLTIGATDKNYFESDTIPVTDIFDLTPLQQIKSIKFNLNINLNPKLKTLDGLGNIDSLEKLIILDNDSLQNIDALNLSSIKTIYFSRLKLLESINGFINLKQTDEIHLDRLPTLKSLSGFSNITKTRSLVLLSLNVDLTGLEKLSEIQRILALNNCPNIRDFKQMTSFKDTMLFELILAQDSLQFSTSGLD